MWFHGVLADLDPLLDLDPRSRSGSGYGLPGPKPLTNMDPLCEFEPQTKLSENIILNVLVEIAKTLRSSSYYSMLLNSKRAYRQCMRTGCWK